VIDVAVILNALRATFAPRPSLGAVRPAPAAVHS
jgi:hypothetical protein